MHDRRFIDIDLKRIAPRRTSSLIVFNFDLEKVGSCGSREELLMVKTIGIVIPRSCVSIMVPDVGEG